jgi:hypothetical protein
MTIHGGQKRRLRSYISHIASHVHSSLPGVVLWEVTLHFSSLTERPIALVVEKL